LCLIEANVSAVLKDCPQGAVFLIGVSGGADSMAMLASLCAVNLKEKLFCMHIEHGIRPAEESRGDADFVRDFCKTNGVECIVKHIPPGKIAETAKRKGIGIEAAARYFRHRALSKAARRIARETSCAKVFILLAHTKDDLLETALMRVLRGAGPAGLAAMPQRRGKIIRPLLAVTRADVIDYLKEKNTVWREDSTNSDIKFLRNRIRHQLVPLLNESFSSWKGGLAALAETQSLAAELISREAEQRIIWKKNFFTTNHTNHTNQCEQGGKGFISAEEKNFFEQPQIIREEAVFQAINSLVPARKALQVKSIRRAVVRRFCESKVNAADLGPVRIKRENGAISISKMKKEYFERGFSRLM